MRYLIAILLAALVGCSSDEHTPNAPTTFHAANGENYGMGWEPTTEQERQALYGNEADAVSLRAVAPQLFDN
jgi:hypothetical protein